MAYGIVVKRVKNNLPRTKAAQRASEGGEGRVEVRAKVSAQQYYEKYTALARESMATGDRVTAESYYQHAEHYLRMMTDIRPLVVAEEGYEPFFDTTSENETEALPYAAAFQPQLESDLDLTEEIGFQHVASYK